MRQDAVQLKALKDRLNQEHSLIETSHLEQTRMYSELTEMKRQVVVKQEGKR